MEFLKKGPRLPLLLLVLMIVSLSYYSFVSGPNVSQTPKASASTSQNVSGFAWSSNVGFITLNCQDTVGPAPSGYNNCASVDHGVNVNTSIGPSFGLLSGYAWNDHVGWITFNSGELSGCPSGNCQARLGTDATGNLTATPNYMTGWARSCSIFVSGCSGALKASSATGGWDGWISLRGTGYGVYLDTDSILKGFAWGDLVLGFIDFNPFAGVGAVFNTPPIVSLTATSPVNYGSNNTINWQVFGGATVCHAQGFTPGWDVSTTFSGAELLTGSGSRSVGPFVVPLQVSFWCTNAFGTSGTASVNIFVAAYDLGAANRGGQSTLFDLNDATKRTKIIDITSSAIGTFTGAVTINASTLGTGCASGSDTSFTPTYTFAPASINPNTNQTAQLTVTFGPTSPNCANYVVTINGNGGGGLTDLSTGNNSVTFNRAAGGGVLRLPTYKEQ